MKPANKTIIIRQGSTFVERLRPSSTTLTFIGASAAGQVRAKYDSTGTPLATFTVTSDTDATGLYFDFTLSATGTAAIPVDAQETHRKKITYACYDIEFTLADGRKLCLMEGTAEIHPEVTR